MSEDDVNSTIDEAWSSGTRDNTISNNSDFDGSTDKHVRLSVDSHELLSDLSEGWTIKDKSEPGVIIMYDENNKKDSAVEIEITSSKVSVCIGKFENGEFTQTGECQKHNNTNDAIDSIRKAYASSS